MHETRTHIIPRAGDLTPGISALEYYNRRLALAQAMPARSVAILPGNRIIHSSGSVFYDFQQDNNLYYLTGWLGPDSVALLEKVADRGSDEDVVLHIICPPKNASTDLWEGDKNGLEAAVDFFNADHAESINKLESYVQKVVNRNEVVFYDGAVSGHSTKFSQFFNFPSANAHAATLSELLKRGRKNVRGLRPILDQHRLVKSEAEIKVMHHAARISSRAINGAVAKVGSGEPVKTEKTLAKYLEYAFVRGGCDKQAYIPVVASGENALTIHYTRNDDLLYEDELVFIDAGGKLGGYCADISRAWPNHVRGFSNAQRDLYQVVLAANKACIDVCSEEDGVSLQDLHNLAVVNMTQGLRGLPGFSSLTRAEVSRDLFPHYIGHHLGLDLHDVPSVSRHAKLRKGNVVTIEPGLYVPFNDKWPRHFQGIGIRVEDDVAVGKSRANTRNLTSLCVKEIQDIEALISAGRVTTPGAHDELVHLDL